MAQYVHKPTVVEAERFKDVSSLSPEFAWAICHAGQPGVCPLGGFRFRDGVAQPHIDTLHGPVQLETGWWIVRELDGAGFYPVAPHVFTASYEPAEVTA